MSRDLQPCPFCGAHGPVLQVAGRLEFMVSVGCHVCAALGPEAISAVAAEEKWNARKRLPRVDTSVPALVRSRDIALETLTEYAAGILSEMVGATFNNCMSMIPEPTPADVEWFFADFGARLARKLRNEAPATDAERLAEG